MKTLNAPIITYANVIKHDEQIIYIAQFAVSESGDSISNIG